MIVEGIFAEDGIIISSLKRDIEVQITGFGSFVVKRRRPRIYKLIRTENAAVPEHKIVTFKRGKLLKDIR